MNNQAGRSFPMLDKRPRRLCHLPMRGGVGAKIKAPFIKYILMLFMPTIMAFVLGFSIFSISNAPISAASQLTAIFIILMLSTFTTSLLIIEKKEAQ